MAIQLPDAPTPNERLLGGWELERHTGLTGTTLTLNRPCYDRTALVFQNGMAVDPDTLAIEGMTVTLGSVASSGDVFVVFYLARSN